MTKQNPDLQQTRGQLDALREGGRDLLSELLRQEQMFTLCIFITFSPRQKLLFNYITIIIMCFSPGKNYGPKGVGFGITANIEAS